MRFSYPLQHSIFLVRYSILILYKRLQYNTNRPTQCLNFPNTPPLRGIGVGFSITLHRTPYNHTHPQTRLNKMEIPIRSIRLILLDITASARRASCNRRRYLLPTHHAQKVTSHPENCGRIDISPGRKAHQRYCWNPLLQRHNRRTAT